MSLPIVSRRQFLAGGGAALAVASVPAWAEIVQEGPSVDTRGAEAVEAALTRSTALDARTCSANPRTRDK